MEIGKLPNDVLEKIIISNIKNKRKEVLVKAAVGEDNAIIDFGNEVCVMSTDPITGATKDIGKLAIHISCNDVASSGAEPIGVLLTILAPPGTSEKDIEKIMRDAGQASEEINIEIMGGHTEITDAVNRIIINTTVVGKQLKSKLPDYNEIEIGDKVLVTKYAGIEGTSIIAKELEGILIDKIGKEKLEIAQNMDSMLSVVEEGRICGEIEVNYMHDITEGGIFGAVWEATKAIGKGIKINKDLIPIKDITKEIMDILEIDIYRLISSGSMLIIAKEEKLKEIYEKLGKLNIKISVIGEIIDKGVRLEKDGKEFKIDPPDSDELYKALSLL
jgi:hydrogenase expression/formation protein HypE